MAAHVRDMSFRLLQLARPRTICVQCRRTFSTTPVKQAGHNKWSKVKHIKGRTDKIKNATRSHHVQAITLYSKLYGPDPNINSSLANAIALAKKDSVPKDVISQAIERGQGRSLTGTALETMKFEAIVAPSVAFIIDVETDNKLRALQDVNLLLRRHKARTTATEFLFSRRGRVVFGKHDTIGLDEMMDNAIELGAEDLENDDDDNVIVWTQPTQTMKLAQGLAKDLDLEILSSDIIWSPNDETRATVDSVADVKALTEFVHALAETPEVQAIYSNAVKGDRVPDEEWEALGSNLDA